MDAKRLAEIEARANRATFGPWCYESVAEKSNDFVVGIALNEKEEFLSGCIDGQEYDEETQAWVEDRVVRVTEIASSDEGLHNANFIAHARTDVPDLLAEISRLKQELTEKDKVIEQMQSLADFDTDEEDIWCWEEAGNKIDYPELTAHLEKEGRDAS